MSIPTIHEMVELVPELYEALRERDSMANLVCETIAKGMRHHSAMSKWRSAMRNVKACVAKAIELHEASKAVESVGEVVSLKE